MFEQNEIHDGVAGRTVPGCNIFTIPERRKKPRVDFDYSAIVEGIDQQGNEYKENAKLANLSAGGLYMRVNRYIYLGSHLTVTILFSDEFDDNEAPKLMTKGIIIRSELQEDGTWGVAIKFTHYRFI